MNLLVYNNIFIAAGAGSGAQSWSGTTNNVTLLNNILLAEGASILTSGPSHSETSL